MQCRADALQVLRRSLQTVPLQTGANDRPVTCSGRAVNSYWRKQSTQPSPYGWPFFSFAHRVPGPPLIEGLAPFVRRRDKQPNRCLR